MAERLKDTSQLQDGRERFGIVGHAVMANRSLNHGAKALYALLATFASPERTAFPSIARLADELAVSTRTIARWLDDLTKHGYLRRKARTGTTTLYVLEDGLAVTPRRTDTRVSTDVDDSSSTDVDVISPLTPVSHEQHHVTQEEKSNDFSLVVQNGEVSLFDALVFISFGPEAVVDDLSPSERGKFMRDGWGPIARMDPRPSVNDVVLRAAEAYARGWSTVTAKTLANNWHDLGKPKPSRDEAKRALFLQRLEGLTK